MDYFPLDPLTLFPHQKVEERQFLSWKENPVTAELIRELHRRIYELNMGALQSSASVEVLRSLQGQVEAYRSLLEWMNTTEADAIGETLDQQ